MNGGTQTAAAHQRTATADARPLYGIMAEFADQNTLREATERTVTGGYRAVETYSPVPVEGMAETLGFHTTLPLLVLIAGIAGACFGFFLQYWISVIDYPILVGGRPFNSWPAFIPVTFECTILFAGVTAVVGMIVLNKLPHPYHPVFNVQAFERASNDRFFLAIESTDPRFDREGTRAFLLSLDPLAVHDIAP